MSTQPTDNLPAEYATIRAALERLSLLADNAPTDEACLAALAALDALAAREVQPMVRKQVKPVKTAHERGEKWCVRHSQYAHSCSDCYPVPAATDAGASLPELHTVYCECPICDPPLAATDAGASALEAKESVVKQSLTTQSTPPAPPAAECAARLALEAFGAWIDHIETCRDICCSTNRSNSNNPESLFLKPAVDAARAALATPCQHGSEQSEIARLRAECEELRIEIDTLQESLHEETRVHLLVKNNLTAELAQARKATEEAVRVRELALEELVTANASLMEYESELRRAVDALRPLAKYAQSIACNGPRADRVAWNAPYEITIGDCQDAYAIVAAYDAKHGEPR